MTGDSLLGRDTELRRVQSFLDSVATNGAALMLLGDPGVGKTSLLDAAAALGQATGMRVLRAVGTEFEVGISFAGLSQLLLPLSAEIDRLPPGQQAAVSLVLGSGGPAGGACRVSAAVLELLRAAAAARPLLIVVDDLPWLDRASASVLGAAARALHGDRVGVLTARRTGEESFFDATGLPELEMGPLDAVSAADLLRSGHPDVAAPVESQLLAAAQGNPLALLDLPAALSSAQRAGLDDLPAHLPLSRRLEGLYSSRVAALPWATRRLLLLAALHDASDLSELLTASGIGMGVPGLATAERAGLLVNYPDTGGVTFRHPVVRATVVATSTSSQRREAHRDLAGLLADDLERAARHMAEATVDPDEQVAGLLERAARSPLAARAQLASARGLFSALGATPWTARAEQELLASSPGSGHGGLARFELTPQERSVAELAAAGLANKQIADRLMISHRTVSAHLRAAFLKLGISTRAGLRDALDAADPASR